MPQTIRPISAPRRRQPKAELEFLTCPPKGMWYEAGTAEKPFRARWRLPGGQKEGAGFATAVDRAGFAGTWVKRKETYGIAAAGSISAKRMEVWAKFEEITGGEDPLIVAREWLTGRKTAASPLTVHDGIIKFHAILATKRVARDTVTHRELHLRRFDQLHGKELMRDIPPATVRRWLYSELRNPDRKDGKFSDAAILQHYQALSFLFDTLRRNSLVAHNPCEAVDRPVIEEKDVHVIPPRDAFEFFQMNASDRAIGAVALEAFGGLRYTSAGRLTADRIKTEAKGIEMPAVDHKSKKRKFRQGHPLNLWAWLDVTPASCWEMTPRQYLEEKRFAFERARLKAVMPATEADREQIKRMHNVWRHSFGSYLLAMTKSLPLVAYLMQHTRTATTEIYEGKALDTDALLYFSLTPESVKMEWPAFVAWASARKPEDLLPKLGGIKTPAAGG